MPGIVSPLVARYLGGIPCNPLDGIIRGHVQGVALCHDVKDRLDLGGQCLLDAKVVVEKFTALVGMCGIFFAHATNVANDKPNGNRLPTVTFFATFEIRAGISPCVTGNNAVDGSRIPVRAPMSDAWVGRSLTA